MPQTVSTISLAALDITAYAGDTFALILLFFNDDAGTIPMDLTQFTWKMQIKKAPIGPVALELNQSDDSLIVGGGDLNEMILVKLINLKGGTYFYDIQATNTLDNFITSFVGGKFIIVQDTTDSNVEK